MYTVCGFSKLVTTQNVVELLSAIPDQHIKTSGNDIIVPELNNLFGYFAIGLTISAVQLASPSLRRLFLMDVAPVENSVLPVFPPDPISKSLSPYPLDVDEALNSYAVNTSATDDQESVIVFLSDGKTEPINGKISTIKATYSVVATAYSWSQALLTLNQSLPVGTYQLVGARCEDVQGIAFRFVFIGGVWRPGHVCVAGVTDRDVPTSRNGQIGVWGTFTHDKVPSIEILRSVAGTTGVIYLDLIKTT